MKHRICLSLVLLTAATMAAGFSSFNEVVKGAAKESKAELNGKEHAFVGKWSGSRDVYKWEIERFPDRRFEIAFQEPDLNDPKVIYNNYAVGTWRIEGDNYYFEWKKWYGDEGDFSGESMEPIKSLSLERVVTLSEGADEPYNVEVRVEVFKIKAWALKPKKSATE